MSNGERRPDKKLKSADPSAKKAKKTAGPKYLRDTMAASPSVAKLDGRKNKS
ncbi:hypothetical protein L1787_08005 [Acuticoccus sp. M5D2P5]|uniref:hypothetical protein n=1 Tax=Acuticoccus TaxID=1904377 RepID=UPI001390C237|nr:MULTISPECIES: hypothetical protein [Acuticoccus]MCF3933351.1 hypothetical protein [Acuticoccus kalidii]